MKCNNHIILAILLASACLLLHSDAFVAPTTSRRSTIAKSSTSLGGTIRFVGKASSSVSGDETYKGEDDDENDKSLLKFLSSDASNKVLMGTENICRLTSTADGEETWECTQTSVAWFGMTLVPIFVNKIERGSAEKGEITTTIVEARTEVEGGGIGNALAKAMKRSVFEGRTIYSFKESGSTYDIDGDLELNLTIKLPSLLPLPPGFNTIGSKIVERTCRERLKVNIRELRDAYIEWAEQ